MAKVHIYREFDSYADARDFEVRTLTLFDPMAYDTHLEMHTKECEGKRLYIVRGSRFDTAD